MLTRSLALTFHEFTVKYYFNNWVWNTQKKKPSNFWPNKGNRAQSTSSFEPACTDVDDYLSSSVVPAASSSAVDSVDSVDRVLCMDVSWSAVLAQTRPPSPASLMGWLARHCCSLHVLFSMVSLTESQYTFTQCVHGVYRTSDMTEL